MATAATGIEAYVGGAKVFAVSGRQQPAGGAEAAAARPMAPGWTPARNGFCLLTGQRMPPAEEAFEETPGSFGVSTLFRFAGARAEAVAANTAPAAAPPPLAPYYQHIAEAAKAAFPEAEYVWVQGHIIFSAEVSPLKNIRVLLYNAATRALAGLLSKVFPCCVPAKAARNSGAKATVPVFGAAEFVHVDESAEQGAEQLSQAIGNSIRLPDGFVSDASKQRRVVSANFWRNLRADKAIKNHHLAVVDAQTVTEDELHAAKFKNYAIGGQEQYHLAVKESHRLVYFPDMAQSEILVFKQGEYEVRRVAEGQHSVTAAAEPQRSFIFHTAIVDPAAPKDAPPRKSIVCAGVKIIMPEAD
uniref:Uncharacterized protein n=1 Tax=Pyrodinium bahamense TaxID=73915 RepID=A0A7S0AAL5_9DINO